MKLVKKFEKRNRQKSPISTKISKTAAVSKRRSERRKETCVASMGEDDCDSDEMPVLSPMVSPPWNPSSFTAETLEPCADEQRSDNTQRSTDASEGENASHYENVGESMDASDENIPAQRVRDEDANEMAMDSNDAESETPSMVLPDRGIEIIKEPEARPFADVDSIGESNQVLDKDEDGSSDVEDNPRSNWISKLIKNPDQRRILDETEEGASLGGSRFTILNLPSEISSRQGAAAGDVVLITKPIGSKVAVNTHKWFYKAAGDMERFMFLDLEKVTERDVNNAYLCATELMARENTLGKCTSKCCL